MIFSISKNSKDLLFLIVSYSILVLLALYHVFMPCNGDQSFFQLVARTIDNGGVLYKDIWDIKQPGIFYFYYLGGKLFSFTDIGIRLFEIFYWSVFSIVLVWFSLSLKIFSRKIFDYLLPFFTVGLYLLSTTIGERAQNEILVSAPLTIIILIFYKYGDSKKISPYFLSGILIAIVLFFKLPFIIIIGCIIIYYVIILFKEGIKFKELFLFKVLPTFVGFIILPTIFYFYIYRHDIVKDVFELFFVVPFSMEYSLTLRFPFSEQFVGQLVKTFPLGLFSLVTIIFEFNKRSYFIHFLAILIFSSLLTIYFHLIHWSYYYQILLFPMGILSLIFIDRYKQYRSFNKKLLILPFLLMFLYIAFYLSFEKMSLSWLFGLLIFPIGIMALYLVYKNKWISSISRRFVLGAFFFIFLYRFIILSYTFVSYCPINNYKLNQYREQYLYYYPIFKAEANYLLRDSTDYDIWVCGDPIIYSLTDRMQSLPMGGWMLEYFNEEQWLELKRELLYFAPKYVYMENDYFKFFTKNKFIELIDSHYINVNSSSKGRWYKHR